MTHQGCQDEGAVRGGHGGWGDPGQAWWESAPVDGDIGSKKGWWGDGHHWGVCNLSFFVFPGL